MNKKKVCKILKKILKNPKNVRFEELDNLLIELGFIKRQPRGGSSHYTYTKKDLNKIITIPFKKPFLKVVYVKMVLKELNLEDFYNDECK